MQYRCQLSGVCSVTASVRRTSSAVGPFFGFSTSSWKQYALLRSTGVRVGGPRVHDAPTPSLGGLCPPAPPVPPPMPAATISWPRRIVLLLLLLAVLLSRMNVSVIGVRRCCNLCFVLPSLATENSNFQRCVYVYLVQLCSKKSGKRTLLPNSFSQSDWNRHKRVVT